MCFPSFIETEEYKFIKKLIVAMKTSSESKFKNAVDEYEILLDPWMKQMLREALEKNFEH